MKKKTTVILIALLLLLLSFALVACNDGGTDTPSPENNPGGEPEITYFDVTFDSNGGTSLSDYDTKVAYGQTISAPKNAAGEAVIPVRVGYEFSGWTLNGGDTFDFANYTITSKTTVKAAWIAKTYTHEAYLFDERLKGNIEGIGDGTARDYYGTDVKILNSEGNDTAVDGSNPPKYTFTTTYQEASASARQSVVAPTTTKTDDYFVYWYYYDDTDDDGASDDIVPFTTRRTASTTGQATLSAAYNTDGTRTLYAMWYSCLEKFEITFDTDGGSTVPTVTQKKHSTLQKPTDPTKAGFEFDYWYYIGEDSNGEEKEYKFNFDDPASTDDDSSANTIVGNVALKSKWVKKYSIGAANASDLAAALSDGENRNAKIYITEDITLDGWTAQCDKSAPFAGTLDGGTYKSDGTLDSTVPSHKITLTNLVAGQYNSLLIANNGTVKNLKISFENFSFKDSEGDFDSLGDGVQTIYVGALASFNCENAVVNAVSVTISGSVETSREVVVGGLTALNNGGEIYDGSVTSSAPISVTATLATAYVGGIAGINDETGGFAQTCAAKVQITVTADKGYAGAFFGTNTGGASKKNIIEDCSVTVNATSKAAAGGFAGFLFAGSCNQFYVKNNVTVTANTTAVNGAASAGGIAGDNWGQVLNCQIDKATVVATSVGTGAITCAGGVTGYNYTDGGSSRGTVKSVMIMDGDVTATANASGAKTYAGGVTGRNYSGIVANVYSSVDVTATVPTLLTSTVGYSIGGSHSSSYSGVFYDAYRHPMRNGYPAKDAQGVSNYEMFTADNIQGIVPDAAGASDFHTIRSANWLSTSLALDTSAWNIPTVNDRLPELLFLND